MISAIGPLGAQRMMDLARSQAAKSARPAAESQAAPETATVATPAALLAAEGAPIDAEKVATIRAAVTSGTYAINPRAIADRMITSDLGYA